MPKRRAVYTAITGGYEALADAPATSGMELPCFTDDPTVTSATWRVVHVPRAFPSDPMRSQRFLKVLGHPELGQFDETLYIDNSVGLRVDPHVILDEWLRTKDIALASHSFRQSVRGEFDAVRLAGLETRERLDEQLEHYSRDAPDVLAQRPYWGAMIARRQGSQAVQTAMDIWMRHILRYARRDQLSINYALTAAGVTPERIELDNHDSPLHHWPTQTKGATRRPTVEFAWQYGLEARSVETAIEERDRCQHALKSAIEERDRSQRMHGDLLASSSWRLTAPIRAAADWIRRR